jgi:hypothetical protein
MFVSKIKFVVALLLAIGLAAGGAAWVTYRAEAAAGPQAATRPAAEPRAPRSAPDRGAGDEGASADRLAEQQKRLERAVVSLRLAEDQADRREVQWDNREEQWLNELIEARLRVLDLREKLKAMERDLNERWAATDPMTDILLRALLNDRDRAKQRLDEAKKILAKENDAVAERLTREVRQLDEQVELRQRALKQEATKRMSQRDELYRLRRGLLVAEENLQALQRRQERQRDGARSDLEDQRRRVRQWRQALADVESGPPPGGLQAADLERKLDRVLRELAELRRALRPQEEKRPEEP